MILTAKRYAQTSRGGVCGYCCAVFSLVGLIFHIFVGSVLVSQPQSIPLIRNAEASAVNAFSTAGIFLTILIGSTAVLYLRLSKSDEREGMPSTRNGSIRGLELEPVDAPVNNREMFLRDEVTVDQVGVDSPLLLSS